MSLTTFNIDGSEYRAYASLEEATVYLRVEPNRWQEWSQQTDDVKQQLLIAATRRVDALLFIGEKADSAQPTEWPRADVPGVDPNAVPARVEQAAILLASTFISTPEGTETGQTGSQVKTIQAGSVTITNFTRTERSVQGAQGQSQLDSLVDQRAQLLLQPYVLHPSLAPTLRPSGAGQAELPPVGQAYNTDGRLRGSEDPNLQFGLGEGLS